jgi:N-acyl homoserine lactone hydrolase
MRDMSSIRIHANETGKVSIKRSQMEGKGHGLRRRGAPLLDREWTEPLPIFAWAIEHPEGLFVVDTGETARTAEPGYLPRFHPYYRLAVRMHVTPDDEIGPRMRALGLDPNDTRRLVMTHLHTDHAGGLHHFRKVPTIIDSNELKVAAGIKGRAGGYLPHRFPDDFDPDPIAWTDQKIGPFDRSFPLTEAGDIVVLPTPGHTPGHVSVLVRDGDHDFLIAGDVAYTDELRLDGVAPDEDAALRSSAQVRELAGARPTVVLPTHDPRSAARLAGAEPLRA